MATADYKQLIAWQKSMDLVEFVYRLTRYFPKEERYGLTNPVRRAVVSVPSNIAEGQGRGVGKEFDHHLRIANGSRQEVETQLLIAQRLGYIDCESLEDAQNLLSELGRIISGLRRSIASK
jgi:four helix bundle protein